MDLRRAALAALVAMAGACLPSIACAIDTSHAWFTPTLTVNADSNCGSLLAAARKNFASTAQVDVLTKSEAFAQVFDNHDNNLIDDWTLRVDRGVPGQYVLSEPGRERLFIYIHENFPNCGGYCATESDYVSTRAFDGKNGDDDEPTNKDSVSTPQSVETLGSAWTIVRAGDGSHYLIGIVQDKYEADHLEAYRIVGPKAWKLSCSVALAPTPAQVAADTEARNTDRSIEALVASARDLSHPAACGGRAAGQFEDAMEQALRQTLFRPWQLAKDAADPHPSENSYGDYPRVYASLEEWSLGGLEDWRAFARYKTQLALTTETLAKFFQTKYHWSEADSQNMAHVALTYAVAQGFGFYMYKPFSSPEEKKLRQAILEHRPISEIEAIPLDVATLNDPSKVQGDESDSVLNIAIEYPEALAYLLKQGFDPNVANDFGKTPLMYAAQDNQREAVQILLQAGANPNARTAITALESCFHVANVTALHYAARYASAPVIRALVDGGAVTFIRAIHPYDYGQKPNGPDEAALEWLRIYTSVHPGVTRNSLIAAADIPVLEDLLRVPDTARLARIATAQALKAEAAYAAGKTQTAYDALVIALAAEPSNRKAASDLPLLALKLGKVDEAAEAAGNAIAALKQPADLAAAWFNMGLVCEHALHAITYNGASYCSGDKIYPFLRAWQIEPTAGRAAKLMEAIGAEGVAACRSGDQQYRFVSVDGLDKFEEMNAVNVNKRVYVFGGLDESVDPASIRWSAPDALNQPTEKLRLVGRFALGDRALSVFDAEGFATPAAINGQPCSLQ
jgi:hypothetical protein